LLPNAPVPDGRTVLTNPDTTSSTEPVLGHGKHPRPFIRDTNTIEALHRQIRKTTKTRGHFPTEEAARKLIYLSITNAQQSWRQTYNWSAALLSFKIHFEDRLP
jgi:putative transposase